MIASPFVSLAGLTWGVFAAPVIGVGTALGWGALGAFAFPFLMYLEQRLVPPFIEVMRRAGFGKGPLAGGLWETGIVGGLVYLATSVFGAPLVPAVGTALGVGAFYAFVMEYVICGSAASDALGLLHGASSVGQARGPGVSRAEALVHQGRHDEAIVLFEAALRRAPRDTSLYVKLARALVEAERPEEAVATLRRGLTEAEPDGNQRAFLVRQMHDIAVRKVGDARMAVPELKALARDSADDVHGAWATRELDDIDAGFYDE